MKPPKGLGKGLRALITESELTAENGATISELAVGVIDPNPFQPRTVFDDAEIEELKQSILKQGVLQPVIVRPMGARFQLVVGERRLRASKAAGRETIPAIIREVASDEEMLELALLENVVRSDLNPIEIAKAIVQLQTRCKLTQEAIADRLGMSRAHVANTVRLLKLPGHIQGALQDRKLTMGHARALLSVADDRERELLFNRFVSDGKLTVRAAEALTRGASVKAIKARLNGELELGPRASVELQRIEQRLQSALATRVKIKPGVRGGTIEIQYYSNDDLERFLELLEP
ncbi:ParB/RepB/Spo0J family partition protein [candidate division KSB1 bacterium]|nr:ParB/RepB/Spo0J family partition protein [candidate division KSB1 bacterium]